MSRSSAIIALAVTLSACQGPPMSTFPTSETIDSSSIRLRNRHIDSLPCASSFTHMREKGGEQNVPAPPDEDNFFGGFHYGPISNFERVVATMNSCSDNNYNTPVPEGFTPDWFGEWNLCGGECSFTFGHAKVLMRMYSSTWVAKRPYYIYLYTSLGGQLIESYPIGTVHINRKDPPYLKFSSPFGNGFVYPANDSVSLEIVHASQ